MSQTRLSDGASILRSLAAVEAERRRRAADPALQSRVGALKAYQQARFRLTHADLLSSDRHGDAARFFLDELYGPADFSRRDAEFGRIVPALVRLFPGELVHTVATLAALHALSEDLDTRMAEQLAGPRIDAGRYRSAWRAVGRAADRELQVQWIVDVGEALDRYTRRPALTMSLRMMRGPARVAGLIELQGFLERGFETFRAMSGAREFLRTIEARERELIEQLFGESGSGQLP